MKVIAPVTISDSNFVSSTIAETDYAAWASGTTYAAGDRVILTSTHKIYQSLQAANTNHNPATATDWWLEVGPTNRWSCFDNALGSACSATTSFTVVIKPGDINAVALLGLVGETVTVTYKTATGGTVIYSQTIDLDGTPVDSFYDWFFASWAQKDMVILTDLPSSWTEGELTITVAGTGTVQLGVLAAGTVIDLGDTMSGAGAGIVDYSRKETDQFGRTTFVQRKYARLIDCKLVFENDRLGEIYTALSELRTTPAVWMPSDATKFESLTVFGIYKNFSIDVAYANVSYCTLTLEGLI